MNFTKMHGLGNDYVYVNGFVERVDDPATLAEIVRVLAPGGRLVVIDFGDIDRPVGPPREHVLPHDELRAVVTGMGLRETAFHEPGDLLVYHVVVVAEKPER